jgi:hypothetical protein
VQNRVGNWNTRISGFFRVYPISALFAISSDSQRINQRKFYTKFCLCNILIPFPWAYSLDSVPLITAWGLNYWVAYRCVEDLHLQTIHVSVFLRNDYERVYLRTFSKSTYFRFCMQCLIRNRYAKAFRRMNTSWYTAQVCNHLNASSEIDEVKFYLSPERSHLEQISWLRGLRKVVFWTKLNITGTHKSWRILLCNIRNFFNSKSICLNNYDLYFRDDFEIIAKIWFA